MVEWFIGFYVPEISAIGLHEHDIISLVDEGYTINADHYQHHSYVDEATGAHMVADIQVSASLFYVTTELTVLTCWWNHWLDLHDLQGMAWRLHSKECSID